MTSLCSLLDSFYRSFRPYVTNQLRLSSRLFIQPSFQSTHTSGRYRLKRRKSDKLNRNGYSHRIAHQKCIISLFSCATKPEFWKTVGGLEALKKYLLGKPKNGYFNEKNEKN